MRNADVPIGLDEEIESAGECRRASWNEMQRETRDYMRRMALAHTNSQAIESMVALWIERAQLEARNV
jgi:hypothetical protein